MGERGSRADARSNRARIVEAARALIDSGDELRMSAVAKAVGVGQGTMYRHFPTREALLTEVYRADVEGLVAAADELLAECDPVTALRRWFELLAEYVGRKRGILAALETDAGADLTRRTPSMLSAAVETLLRAGRAEGAVRDEVEAYDVLLLLAHLAPMDPREAAERGPRTLDLILNGLLTRD